MNTDHQYMPQRQLFKLNVCRLCSHIRDKVLPIFDNAGSKIDEKIKECFPHLNIRKDDSKPQHICIDCITKLNMFNEFLQVCMESECKFDKYVKQYIEQESILKSALLHNNLTNPSLWQEEVGKPQESHCLQNDDGVIVLSKMDSALRDTSVQDFVVMVELKYKDKTTGSVPCNNADYNFNKIPSVGLNCSSTQSTFSEAVSHKEVIESNLIESGSSPHVDAQGKQELRENESMNNKGVKDKKSYACVICGHSFTRRTRLNAHMSRHTSIKPHKCDKCDKAFAMHGDLTAHKRIHTETYVCHTCQKSFSSKSKLVRHSRVHTGERPFSCSDCGKSFGEKRNLENHIRAHTGDKPYSCTLCGKAFGVRSHLKDHLSVHKKTPRFNCSVCCKSFKWKTNYNRHMRTHGTDTL